jgi:NTE family protein
MDRTDGDARPVIGLALGGGAVRGLAHLGVLRAFERHDLVPDIICGTSSGAIIGGAVASGWTPSELIDIASRLRWTELVRASPRRDRLFDTQGLERFIASLIAARNFNELDRSFAAVAQDRTTGERVVLRRGDPVRAVAASSAIRRAFPPVRIDGRSLVDGIGVERVPVLTARELGATYVVGVDVFRTTVVHRARMRAGRPPRSVFAETDVDADLTIAPALGSISPWDFSAAQAMIDAGEAAGERACAAIRAVLET